MISYLAGPGGGGDAGIGGQIPRIDILHFFYELYQKLEIAVARVWALLNSTIELDGLEWLLELVGIDVELSFTVVDAMFGGGLMVILAIGIFKKFLA